MNTLLSTPCPVMEPVLDHHLQDHIDFCYQLKWDGVRILCHMSAGQVRLWNKRQHERTIQYPELQNLPRYIKGSTAILDGEAVVLRNGKPSFPAIMSRDRCLSVTRAAGQKPLHTVEYMIFDLLHLDGQNLTGLPLAERHRLLEDRFYPSESFHLVEDFAQGTLLFAAVKEQGLEGIVAKNRNSLYHPGKSHRDWFKYKNRQRCQAVVGGYLRSGSQIKSLLLGLFQGEQLVYIGKAGSGLNDRERADLAQELPKLNMDSSPFINLSRKARDVNFVHPLLVLWVEFAEWSDDLRLRDPVITGFSSQPPEECHLTDLSD
ncbi:MAG TPA: non-homologous end-joining DNA ligase [Syntrophomonadaceae bacterium]|nr:non-homologous end-joining DNA ligase [Syntrophomonadaceae bacterium]